MIYLDCNSTTPVAAPVLEAMIPVFSADFGNPSSAHPHGQQAAGLVNAARRTVADHLACNPGRVTFTSGSTESLNLAIQGLDPGPRKRILVGATEHKAVLESALARDDMTTTVLPVLTDGTLDLEALDRELSNEVALVAVMAVNNETGVINNIRAVAERVHAAGAFLLCDATQAVGRIALSELTDADLLSISAHKIYGPKGVGALIAQKEALSALKPQVWGGGQERGLRAGTTNVPGIVGLAAALQLVESERDVEAKRQRQLRDSLLEGLQARISGVRLNGSLDQMVCNTLNVRIVGVDGDALLVNLESVQASTGSACQSSVPGPSHVLTAMGLTNSEAEQSIRLSIGRFTSETDIAEAIEDISRAVQRVRDLEAA